MPTTYAIPKGNQYFDATLWTGNGTGARAISGVNFQPDMVWLKTRSTAYYHQVHDSVRGASAGALYTNSTNAQDSSYPITSFNTDGFTLGNSAALIADSFASQNYNGTTMVSWEWKGGGTAVTNTAGSITSSVSANTTSGFSVVTWTGVGGTGTVGHGLSAAPKMIMAFPRSFVSDKYVYSASIGAANYFSTNLTDGSASTTLWNSTSPTTSVFTVNGNGVNQNTSTYVAYCWAEIAGYSKFGSYVGNGSSDGPFVYCGFRPKYVIRKGTAAGTDWVVMDSVRSPYNAANAGLYPNLSIAENTGPILDILSNGFKVRATGTDENINGNTYIYMAFAENPTKYANAR